MASTTSLASVVSLPLSSNRCSRTALFARPQLSLIFPPKPNSSRALKSLQLKRNGAFSNGIQRFGWSSGRLVVRCDASTGRIAAVMARKTSLKMETELTKMGYSKELILGAFSEVLKASNNEEICSLWLPILCHLRKSEVYGSMDKYARLMQKLKIINVEFFKYLAAGDMPFFIFETFGQQKNNSGRITQDCD